MKPPPRWVWDVMVYANPILQAMMDTMSGREHPSVWTVAAFVVAVLWGISQVGPPKWRRRRVR